MNIEVNYLAIRLAGIVSMGIGLVWYSYAMFAKPWMKLMGYTKEIMKKEQKKMGPLYGLSFGDGNRDRFTINSETSEFQRYRSFGLQINRRNKYSEFSDISAIRLRRHPDFLTFLKTISCAIYFKLL